MSAAERARLARAARAILGEEALPGKARGTAVRRTSSRPAIGLADLHQVPSWLPADPSRREQLVRTAGVAALAPAIARIIDGAKLRRIAEEIGPDLLDWAMRIGPSAQPLDPEAVESADVSALGNAVVRSALPEAFSAWYEGANDLSPDQARWALDRTLERVA